jgi:hypothetical protein
MIPLQCVRDIVIKVSNISAPGTGMAFELANDAHLSNRIFNSTAKIMLFLCPVYCSSPSHYLGAL